MDDYIKRADAILEFASLNQSHLYPFKVEKHIRGIPAADVVEVVRCKDCGFWRKIADAYEGQNAHLCEFTNHLIGGNGYCCHGERRRDDATD